MKEFILFFLNDISIILKIEKETKRIDYFVNLYISMLKIMTKFYQNKLSFLDDLIGLLTEYLKDYKVIRQNKIIKLVNDTIENINKGVIEL